MKLSYYVPSPDALPITLADFTPLPAGEWEIQSNYSSCSGKYLLALTGNVCPQGASAIGSMIQHMDSDPAIAAVVARAPASTRPPLPTLLQMGATLLRKSVLDRIGGLSKLLASAADYDLTFRILAIGCRISHRNDIEFQSTLPEHQDVIPEADPSVSGSEPEPAKLEASAAADSLAVPSTEEIACLLAVAKKLLPENLSQIYWEDWSKRYKALSAYAGKKTSRHGAALLARWIALRQPLASQDPVSEGIAESVLGFRRHAAAIGDWARRSSVWRVVLADYSDNIYATFNACRASGLQMRYIADNNPAFKNVHYRNLPVCPVNRAFEAGSIDGVILTTTDPAKIDSNFKTLRAYFHGPILKLNQPSMEATHAQPQSLAA